MGKGLDKNEFYCFISNSLNYFYKADYDYKSNPVITTQQKPIVLNLNPINLSDFSPSFGTNKKYMAGVRGVTDEFKFSKDGADILRYIFYTQGGFTASAYFTIIRRNPDDDIYYLYHKGKFDFKSFVDDFIKGVTINVLDDGVWANIAEKFTNEYEFECNASNPLCIPVLLDGISLKAKYTYQPVVNSTIGSNTHPSSILPIILVNTDGDSSGIITRSQSYEQIPTGYDPSYVEFSTNYLFFTQRATDVNITGNLIVLNTQNTETLLRFTFGIFSNKGKNIIYFNETIAYQETKVIPINLNISLDEGESLFFVGNGSNSYSFLLDNIFISVLSKATSSICYAFRPLDLLKQLLYRASNGRFTANSDFYTINNRKVVTSGDSIRNSPIAKISTSIDQWFKSYSSENWITFIEKNGEFFVDLFTKIYDSNSNLFLIGEVEEAIVEVATEYIINKISVGSPKQDYRHASGRLEFNATNKFNINSVDLDNELDLVSVYRKDGYGAEFIRIDYQQESSHDNVGDNQGFMLDITDNIKSTDTPIENFQDVEISSAPLSPIIYYPLQNETIFSESPRVQGVSQPNQNIKIYVDGNLDGNTNADLNGNWSYDIQSVLSVFVDGVSDGLHTIEATFSDLSGTTSSVTIICQSDQAPTKITYPLSNSNLYNNKPLLKGLAPKGTNLNIYLDNNLIGSTFSDNSSRWEFKMPVIQNGNHIIRVNNSLGINVSINSFTDVPLITSFFDGFTITNNLPLVEGVAKPGTKVDLWLDYYPNVSIGTGFADLNGNWSIQLTQLFKIDGVSILTPIPEGNHIISTSLEIMSSNVGISGYELNRPNYSNLVGVIDNSVYNTEMSPKRNLLSYIQYFKSIFYQQPNTVIVFDKGDKNQQFSTTLDGITIKENDDLKLADYSDDAIFLPLILKAKVKSFYSFANTIKNFSNGGLVKCTNQGTEIYALPIGKMEINNVVKNIQEWQLLLSVKTPLISLLKLSSPGSKFNIMENSVYRNNYNTLQFVSYDYTLPHQYKNPEIDQDWFEFRNNGWINNPIYIQKWEKSMVIVDQIVSNGVSGTIVLDMYDCKTGKLVDNFTYQVVSQNPAQYPDVVQEAVIDIHSHSDGQYFFVAFANSIPFAISERINISDSFEDTFLIESKNSENKSGAYFSTGWKSVIRIEGNVGKWQASIDTIVNKDDIGNFDILNSINTNKRIVQTEFLPDYVYIKMVAALTLDGLKIEGVDYVLSPDANLEPIEKVEGMPLYRYNIELVQKDISKGTTFDVGQGNFRNGVTLVVDSESIGYGGGGVEIIELND